MTDPALKAAQDRTEETIARALQNFEVALRGMLSTGARHWAFDVATDPDGTRFSLLLVLGDADTIDKLGEVFTGAALEPAQETKENN